MIFNFFNGFEFTQEELNGMISFSIIFNLITGIIFYIFKAIAIFTMAKRKNLKNLWMAFVPFVNFILLGKIIGKVILWGHELKNIGLWVCLLCAVNTVLSAIVNYNSYLFFIENMFNIDSGLNAMNTESVSYNVIYYSSDILELVYLLLYVSIIFAVFRMYKPEKALFYSLLSIFLDLFGILLFSVRNREPIAYEDYLRSRIHRNYYGGYNGGGYNQNNNYNQNNGYNRNEQNTSFRNNNTENKTENPFPEFNSDSKDNENTNDFFKYSENDKKSEDKDDDLFN